LPSVPFLFYIGDMAVRCRLCSTNDRDALVEDVAREVWESGGHSVRWEDTFPQWHMAYRRHADALLRALERDHDHAS
jgi:hypothetical protein